MEQWEAQGSSIHPAFQTLHIERSSCSQRHGESQGPPTHDNDCSHLPTEFALTPTPVLPLQTTPLIAGLAVGAAAYAARTALVAFQSFKAAGPRMRQFYKGGFQSEMSRREASLILGEAVLQGIIGIFQTTYDAVPLTLPPPPPGYPAGVRESAPEEKIKEAHRRIMVANHPDRGGSRLLATKVNEAKDMLMGKKSGSQSIF